MEIRMQPALSQGVHRPTRAAAQPEPEPADTVEFRRPGWLGIGWRGATLEQARERVAEGKTVEVRDGTWVPLEQPDDLSELEFFRGQNPKAPSDFGQALKALAEAGGRFAGETELGPFGAYHELERGRAVELTMGERKLALGKPQDACMAAFFHDLGPAPTETAGTLRTLYRSGLELGGSPVDPPLPVRASTAEGVELLVVEDLRQPVDEPLRAARERWQRLDEGLKERAPEAMQLLRGAPLEHEQALMRLCAASTGVPSGLYEAVRQDSRELGPALEALEGCSGDEARAQEFLKRCRAEGDPVSGKALLLSEKLGGHYSQLARLQPEQLEFLGELAAMPEPSPQADEPWQRDGGAWVCRYRNNEDSSLTFPSVKLGEGSRLELTAQYQLENGCDRLRVEVRPKGGDWRQVASFTGRSEEESLSVDLSACDGQEAELRLRLTSDSSTVYDGVRFRELRLLSGGRVLTGTDRGDSSLEELIRTGPPAEELKGVLADARQCGPGVALALWKAGATGLGALAAQVGLTPALALKDLGPGGGAALELARKLSPGRPQAEQLELARKLHAQKVEPTPFLELERNLSRPPAWQAEGDWSVVETDQGRVWRHGAYPNHASVALTLPEARGGTRLSYRLKTHLEQGCDFLVVEGRRAPEGDWVKLRSHTGTGEGSDQEVPLSGVDQVRFRLTSDSSHSGEGVELSALRVDGPGGRLLAFDEGSAGHAQLLELALSGDAARLEEVRRLASQTGSTAAALTLQGKGDGQLATLIGVEPALALGGLSRPADEVAAMWNACGALQDSFQQPTDRAARSQLARSLVGSDVTATELARLAAAGTELDWQPDPGWERVREQDALVWRKTYGDNESSSLVSPSLDLTGVQGARLMFEHSYGLESGCDFVRLECQPEGGDWVRLKSFTGRQSPGDEIVDLSRFDGQRVRLRWRLESDSSHRDEGYRLGSVLVNGLTDLRPPARLDEALRNLAAIPATERAGRLDELEGAAARLGSREAALELWPDLSEGRLKLAETLGLKEALKHADQADRLLECFELARRLCHENGEPADRRRLLGLGEKLLAARLSESERKSLAELAAQKPPAWACEAPWKAERGGYGFGRYPDHASASLSLPPLDLEGLKDTRIQFELKHDLETGCDHLLLEARREGSREWEVLDQWTGKSQAWTERDLDLSSLDGQKAELRLRLSSDSSHSGEGASVRALRVRARAEGEELPRTLAQMPEGTASASDLIELVTSKPSILAELSPMSSQLESAAAAVELWPAAESNPAGVTRLARALGLERARELGPLVGSEPDVARLIGLYEASWRLSMALTAPPPDAERLAMVRELMPLGVDAEQVRRLTALVAASEAPPAGVIADPGWSRVNQPGRGLTYRTGR